MKKFLPWIFLTVLVAVGAFLGGTQYGKNVQDVNEALVYIRENMQQPTPLPTQTAEPLAFRNQTDSNCNISFTIPESLQLSSDEAIIRYLEADIPVIEYSCVATDEAGLQLVDPLLSEPQAVAFALLGEDLIASTSADQKDDTYYFSLEQEERLVELKVHQRYLPLLSETFQLLSE